MTSRAYGPGLVSKAKVYIDVQVRDSSRTACKHLNVTARSPCDRYSGTVSRAGLYDQVELQVHATIAFATGGTRIIVSPVSPEPARRRVLLKGLDRESSVEMTGDQPA